MDCHADNAGWHLEPLIPIAWFSIQLEIDRQINVLEKCNKKYTDSQH